jgi:hypothetical protein
VAIIARTLAIAPPRGLSVQELRQITGNRFAVRPIVDSHSAFVVDSDGRPVARVGVNYQDQPTGRILASMRLRLHLRPWVGMALPEWVARPEGSEPPTL